jgi:nucleoside-diphosphate-sugar epimerase
MRLLLAGPTGAIGPPLIRGLKQQRHWVFGLVRSAESTRILAEMDVEAVIGDALNAASARAAIAHVRPDAVITSPPWRRRDTRVTDALPNRLSVNINFKCSHGVIVTAGAAIT